MKPHRGALILVLGILSLTLCGIFTGLPAWFMGNRDLEAMEAGTMDGSGRGLTSAGVICGRLSTVLNLLFLALYAAAVFLHWRSKNQMSPFH